MPFALGSVLKSVCVCVCMFVSRGCVMHAYVYSIVIPNFVAFARSKVQLVFNCNLKALTCTSSARPLRFAPIAARPLDMDVRVCFGTV